MLAIWRQGNVLVDRLGDVKLRAADVLLLKGARKNMQDLQQNNQVLVLEPLELERQRTKKAPLAVGILGISAPFDHFRWVSHFYRHGDRVGVDGADRLSDDG